MDGVHSSDVSVMQIILFQLTGIENYSIWARSMCIALLGRTKLGLVNESCGITGRGLTQ